MASQNRGDRTLRDNSSNQAVAMFLAPAVESGKPAEVVKAVGQVIRARGVDEVARKTGLSRSLLLRSFGPKGNPSLRTLMAVFRMLDIDLSVTHHLPRR